MSKFLIIVATAFCILSFCVLSFHKVLSCVCLLLLTGAKILINNLCHGVHVPSQKERKINKAQQVKPSPVMMPSYMRSDACLDGSTSTPGANNMLGSTGEDGQSP